MLTVLIISKRRLFRKTFAKMLSVMEEHIVCIEREDQPDELLASEQGMVLLDAAQHNAQWASETVLTLLSLQPEAAVTLVLDEQDDVTIDAAMGVGAQAVLIKAAPPQVLIASLQRVLDGERCRPTPVTDIAREDIPPMLRAQLSARQQKMLRAMMSGQSMAVTARSLGVTPAKLVNEMRQINAIVRGRAG